MLFKVNSIWETVQKRGRVAPRREEKMKGSASSSREYGALDSPKLMIEYEIAKTARLDVIPWKN